jgi:hypothetical protein
MNALVPIIAGLSFYAFIELMAAVEGFQDPQRGFVRGRQSAPDGSSFHSPASSPEVQHNGM